jgi:hypothetical protein
MRMDEMDMSDTVAPTGNPRIVKETFSQLPSARAATVNIPSTNASLRHALLRKRDVPNK